MAVPSPFFLASSSSSPVGFPDSLLSNCFHLLSLRARKVRNRRVPAWQFFASGSRNQNGRQEFSGRPQNSRNSGDAGATNSDEGWTLANGLRYSDHSGNVYRDQTAEDGPRRDRFGPLATSSMDPTPASLLFGEDRIDRTWELDAEELRLEQRHRAVWQPAELEAVGFGREADLRFMFLELLMGRAREGDVAGAEEAMSDMSAIGLKAGPRSYHGLVVSYSRSGDAEGALQAVRREVNVGHRPLPETFVALVRLFAALGEQRRGEEMLSSMAHYKLNSRIAWLAFVEDLLKGGHLKEATDVFLRGAKVGLKATDQLFDALVEANANVGDHANCIYILRQMEYTGRTCKTFHYNCLLMVEAKAGEADIALERFEQMRYGNDDKKPDTESYNWLIEAQIRCESGGDRIPQVVDLVGIMVEDYKRVSPNAKTHVLLVECFTKYSIAEEATRHFRALSRVPGGMQLLHNNGEYGDPLSLYLRLLCLEGRIDDLYEALEVLEKDNQLIPSRAMIVNRKGRTLVSSWIEPIQQEAELGYEIDYIARYIAEGGVTGTRQRWSPSSDGKSRPINPDDAGFAYGAPMEVSFKRRCGDLRATYAMYLLRKLRREGAESLGPGATEEDLAMVIDKLRRDSFAEMIQPTRKPKAASKMLVSELKEELEAQGLPSDGTRPVLYQRVQKARRINQARGRPLWLPPEVETPEKVDTRFEKFMSTLNLKNEFNTEYWRKRFLDETEKNEVKEDEGKDIDSKSSSGAVLGGDGDDGDGEEDAVEETEDLEDGGEEEEPAAPETLSAKLIADDELEMQRRDEYYFEFNLEEQLAALKRNKRFGAEDMYTLADVWGWTWEKDIGIYQPEKWSKEREVTLGIKLMRKVVALGGVPTIGDCAILLRAALRTPWPEAMVDLLQQTHKLGYVFGSTLYDEVVTVCIKLDEREAAIAIVTDMEDSGINVPDGILDKILPSDELSLGDS